MQNETTTWSGKTVVVVPSYNGGDETLRCVELLREHSGGATIVVVDNASNDGTVERVNKAYHDVVVLSEPTNTGYAGAAARGHWAAREYGADFLCIVNQDVEVTEGWLDKVLAVFDDEQVATAQPLVMDSNNGKVNAAGCAIHYLGFGYAIGNGEDVDKAMMNDVPMAYASGACLVVRMSALGDDYVCMADFFMYHEDLDLGWRMQMRGYKNVLVRESVVNHRYEFGRSSKIKYEYGERNRLRVLLMNYEWWTLLLLAPALIVMEVGIVMLSIWVGWFQQKVRGYWWVIVELPSILQEREHRQKLRRVRDRHLTEMFASTVQYQEGAGPLLQLANPIFGWYWKIVKRLI